MHPQNTRSLLGKKLSRKDLVIAVLTRFWTCHPHGEISLNCWGSLELFSATLFRDDVHNGSEVNPRVSHNAHCFSSISPPVFVYLRLLFLLLLLRARSHTFAIRC